MSEKDMKKNIYAVLGVSDARAKEMSAELQTLRLESQDKNEILTLLAERYDPESIVMGMYLAVYLMEQEGRLLPEGIKCTVVNPSLC